VTVSSEHDEPSYLAADRLEGGAEMLHRLDRDQAIARRITAERGDPVQAIIVGHRLAGSGPA